MALHTTHTHDVWRMDLVGWSDLSESDRLACANVVAGLGGTAAGAAHGEFRRYRTAQICARSLNRQLGITSRVYLGPSGPSE